MGVKTKICGVSTAEAVNAALVQGERRVEDSPTYPLSVVERVGELGFAIVGDDGDVLVGTEVEPLAEAPDAQIGDIIAETLPPVDFNRINAQNAKQGIVQKVRDAERERQYD